MSKYKTAGIALAGCALAIAANYVDVNEFVNGPMPEKNNAMATELSPSQKACREGFSIYAFGYKFERATVNQKCLERRFAIDTIRNLDIPKKPLTSRTLGL